MNEQKATIYQEHSVVIRREYLFAKRLVDILLSIIAIIMLTPLFLSICMIILILDGGPIIFKQTRTGKDGAPFTIYKFRTMPQTTATQTYTKNWQLGVPDDFVFKSNDPKNISKLGRFLRKSSLDELPQLFNVLKGEMSLVGPRPEVGAITQYYNNHQRKRLQMKPGITGYAQINGRSNISHGEKIAHDTFYIEHCSLRMDIHIMFATFGKLIYTNDNY